MTMVSQSSPGALPAGKKIGKYEVQAQIATGGMAIIYKGLDPSLARLVAIKQIAPHLSADPRFVERFRGEAQTLARLSSSQANIVSVYELIEQDGQLYMVMEYVEGTTLRSLMDRGPVPLQTGLGILLSTALGLRAMHVQNIVHRDLSPANIMVAQDGALKITDFGLIGHSGGKTSLPMGTTKYMAPEMFTGAPVDPRADLYSLGFIAYEMFAGPQKFGESFKDVLRDEKAQQVRWMHWHSNPAMKAPPLKDIQPGVPPLISKIIERMMEKDPAKRFASADQIIRWFRRIFVMHVQGKSVSMSESENLEKEMDADTGTSAAAATMAAMAAGRAVPAVRGVRPLAAPGTAAGTAVAPAVATGEKTAPLPTVKWTWQKAAFWAALIGGPLIMTGIALMAWSANKGTLGDRVAKNALKEAQKLFVAGEFGRAAVTFEEFIGNYQDDPQQRARVLIAIQGKWLAKAEEAFKADDLEGSRSNISMSDKNGLDPKVSSEFHKKMDNREDIKRQEAEIAGLIKDRQWDAAIERMQFLAQNNGLEMGPRIEAAKQAKSEEIWTNYVKKGDEAAAGGSIAEALKNYRLAKHEKETPELDEKILVLTRNQNFAALCTKALTLFAQGKLDEAMAAANGANAIQPSQAMTDLITKAKVAKLQKEAEALELEGLKDKALDKWRAILPLDPTNPKAQSKVRLANEIAKRDDFRRSGDLAMGQKKYDEAIQAYRQAVNLTDGTEVKILATLKANILECQYQTEMVAAAAAEAADEWDIAGTHLNTAQGYKDTPAVKDAIANLATNRDYKGKFTVGKELAAQKKWLQAEKAFEDAQKVKDTPEVREQVRECGYQRHLARGQEMAKDPSQIEAAVSWLEINAMGKANQAEKVYLQALIQEYKKLIPAKSGEK